MAAASSSGSANGVRAGKAFVEFNSRDAGLVDKIKQIELRFRAMRVTIQNAVKGLTLGVPSGLFSGIGKIAGIGPGAAAAIAEAARGMRKFGDASKQAGLSSLKIGGLITSPVALAAKTFVQAGSDATDMAARLGTTVETVTGLGYAASQAGTSVEEMEQGLAKIRGLTGDLDEGLNIVADAIANASSEQEQFNIAQEAFGSKSGRKMLSWLKDGSAGLKKLREEGLRATGMTSGLASEADKIGDALGTTGAILKSFVVQVGASMFGSAAGVQQFANQFLMSAEGIRAFIRENGEVIRTVALVGGGLVAGGAALAGLGFAVSGVVTVVSSLAGVLAAVASPMALVIAGGAALGAGLAAVAAESMNLGASFNTAWEGIAAALKTGDLGAAAKIGFASVEAEWVRLCNSMRSMWQKVVGDVSVGMGAVMDDPKGMLGAIWDDFKINALGMSPVTTALNDKASRNVQRRVEIDRQEKAQLEADNAARQAEADAALKAQADAAKKKANDAQISGWFRDAGMAIAGYKNWGKRLDGGIAAAQAWGGVKSAFAGSGNLQAQLGMNDDLTDHTKKTAENTSEIAKLLKKGPQIRWGD